MSAPQTFGALDALSPRLRQDVQAIVLSAARAEVITQSRLREITGLGIPEARQATSEAPYWPVPLWSQLESFTDLLNGRPDDTFVRSWLTAYGLDPVEVREMIPGHKDVLTRGGRYARLYYPVDEVIVAVLKPWGIVTPPAAWKRTMGTL